MGFGQDRIEGSRIGFQYASKYASKYADRAGDFEAKCCSVGHHSPSSVPNSATTIWLVMKFTSSMRMGAAITGLLEVRF